MTCILFSCHSDFRLVGSISKIREKLHKCNYSSRQPARVTKPGKTMTSLTQNCHHFNGCFTSPSNLFKVSWHKCLNTRETVVPFYIHAWNSCRVRRSSNFANVDTGKFEIMLGMSGMTINHFYFFFVWACSKFGFH